MNVGDEGLHTFFAVCGGLGELLLALFERHTTETDAAEKVLPVTLIVQHRGLIHQAR